MQEVVNKLFVATIILIIIILGYAIEDAVSDTSSTGATTNTQTNTSGSNTAISGGYSQETTNNYTGGQTNTTSNSTNAETAVNSANSPSMSVYGQDSCVIPLAAGVTVIGFSGSFGSYMVDEACERRKKAKLLNTLGMKVASISLMCQDVDVWQAMMDAGTPCPVDGLIGQKAKQRWDELGNEKVFDTVNATSSGKFRHHRKSP